MAAIGVGSILATFGLKWLKRRLGANGQAALGAIGAVVALCLLAAAREPILALVASLIYGAASIVALTTFFVSAQVALPEWVRGRGLAIFLTVYFGALTLGSAVWGEVATVKGVPFALTCAGAGTLIGMALTWTWKLQTNEAQDLTPSMRWRAPSFLVRVTGDRGPVLAIAEYRIDPKDSAAFLAVMQDISLERKRDGAYAWHIFEDPDDEGKIIETYLVHSVLELRYRESRITKADEMIEDGAAHFLRAPAETRFLIAPRARSPPAGVVAEGARRPPRWRARWRRRQGRIDSLAEERANELRLRMIDNMPWRADLFDAAQVHDRDPVGDLHRLDLIVSDEDRRELGAPMNFAQPKREGPCAPWRRARRMARRAAACAARWRARGRRPRAASVRRRAGRDNALRGRRAARHREVR